MSEEVKLEGFLVTCHPVSEDRMSFNLDISDIAGEKPRLMEFLDDLSDLLGEIDHVYVSEKKGAEKRLRGRSLRARYRVIRKPSRAVFVRFSPYPSRFSNILRSLRQKLYMDVLPSHAITLQTVQLEYYARNLYLLPYSKAPHFMETIEDLNKTIQQLNTDIGEYHEGTDFTQRIKDLLKRFEIRPEALDQRVQLPLFRAELTPIALSHQTIEGLVEEKYKEGFENVKKQLDEQRRELITATVGKLKEQLDYIVKNLIEAKKAEAAERQLKELNDLTNDLGLKYISNTIIIPSKR